MSKKSEIENAELNDKELNNFLAELETYAPPTGRSKDKAWAMLLNAIEEKKDISKTKVIKFPIRTALSIAASVALLLITWFSYRTYHFETFSVGKGKTAELVLPDGSLVRLNAGSEVRYNKYSWKKNRHINLDGEAFFEVVHGKSFVVESNGNTISVLGTGFNVYSRNDKFEVQCYSGKVKVGLKNTSSVILVKGKGVKLLNNIQQCDTFIFNPKEIKGWRKGEFYFQQQKLNFVFDELERQYNITVHSPDFRNRLYTGYFRNIKLQEALDNVCLPMGLKYTITDSANVIITPE